MSILNKGIVVIPGSGNPDHIKENLDLFGFELKEDVKLPVKAGISALSEYSMLALLTR